MCKWLLTNYNLQNTPTRQNLFPEATPIINDRIMNFGQEIWKKNIIVKQIQLLLRSKLKKTKILRNHVHTGK